MNEVIPRYNMQVTGNKILMLKLRSNYKMVIIGSDSLEDEKSLYLLILLLKK